MVKEGILAFPGKRPSPSGEEIRAGLATALDQTLATLANNAILVR